MRRSPSPWSSVPTDPSTEDAEPNVASLCPQLKWRYERCFQHWYTADFLTGNSTQLPCQDEYKRYQQCILVSRHHPQRRAHQHLLLSGLLTSLFPCVPPAAV